MTSIVTAAVILIGDELLSDRTQDTNLRTIAEFLGPLGVEIREARMITDVHETIVATINEMRAAHDYVFTTGGIGPTHDDITTDCIAAAFGVAVAHHEEAVRRLTHYYGAAEATDVRLRMARIPDGADLIANPVSVAPGWIAAPASSQSVSMSVSRMSRF